MVNRNDTPPGFGEFAAETKRRFGVVERRLDAVEHGLEAVKTRLTKIENRLTELEHRLTKLEHRLTKLEHRFDRFEDDMGLMRAAHARNVVERRYGVIARLMGLRERRLLSEADLFDLAQAGGADVRSAEISGDIESYIEADLLFEAEDEQGHSCYVAVEVSYTANGRDTARVLRNAGLTTRFTGQPCRPVVASVRIDNRIKDQIEAGQMYWYRLPQRALQVA